jgi:protein involved in polysaccharide export with SLBB domain
MIGRRRWLGAIATLVAVGCGPRGGDNVPLPPAASPENRALGPGDVIEVLVGDRKDLSGEYEVGDDYAIRFPWIGAVAVKQKTHAEIAADIETRLKDGWLKQPQVRVRVKERQNREVSVLGQVKEAGSYPFKPGLTLMQAISLAGGMNPLAQQRKVKLIRETDKGRQTFEVDVTDILDSRRADLQLEPGDIVFVPESPI